MDGWLVAWLVGGFICLAPLKQADQCCRRPLQAARQRPNCTKPCILYGQQQQQCNTSNVKKQRYTNYVKRQQQWQKHEKNTRNKKLYICKSVYTIYICSVSLKYLKAGGATSLLPSLLRCPLLYKLPALDLLDVCAMLRKKVIKCMNN